MEENKILSAEEIVDKHLPKIGWSKTVRSRCLSAIQEYAQTAEVEELRIEKMLRRKEISELWKTIAELKKNPSLPTDKETEKWFEENIGIKNDCSASSAIYKFRLWLREYAAQFKQPPQSSLTDEDIERMAEKEFPVTMQDIGRTLAGGKFDVDVYWGERKAFTKGYKAALTNRQQD